MRRLLSLVFLVCLMSPLVLGRAAVATDLDVCPTCTHTTIQSAIDAAGPGDRIRVSQGTYYENLIIGSPKTVTISGGWSADFSTQANDPSLTVVDGGGTDRALHVYGGPSDVTAENITFQNGNHSWGGCIRIAPGDGQINFSLEDVVVQNCHCPQGHGGGICLISYDYLLAARLTNVIVRESYTADAGGAIWAGSDAKTEPGEVEVYITNSTIYSNQADREAGGIAIWAEENSRTRAVIINSTITGNSSSNTYLGGGGVVVSDDNAPDTTVILEMYNTILYGNTASPGADLSIRTGGTQSKVDVHYSDLNDLYHLKGAFNQANNLNTAPLFVDSAGGDFHLRPPSPLVDAGTATVPDPPGLPATDFEGDPRVIGLAPDMGADEAWRHIYLPVVTKNYGP